MYCVNIRAPKLETYTQTILSLRDSLLNLQIDPSAYYLNDFPFEEHHLLTPALLSNFLMNLELVQTVLYPDRVQPLHLKETIFCLGLGMGLGQAGISEVLQSQEGNGGDSGSGAQKESCLQRNSDEARERSQFSGSQAGNEHVSSRSSLNTHSEGLDKGSNPLNQNVTHEEFKIANWSSTFMTRWNFLVAKSLQIIKTSAKQNLALQQRRRSSVSKHNLFFDAEETDFLIQLVLYSTAKCSGNSSSVETNLNLCLGLIEVLGDPLQGQKCLETLLSHLNTLAKLKFKNRQSLKNKEIKGKETQKCLFSEPFIVKLVSILRNFSEKISMKSDLLDVSNELILLLAKFSSRVLLGPKQSVKNQVQIFGVLGSLMCSFPETRADILDFARDLLKDCPAVALKIGLLLNHVYSKESAKGRADLLL